MRQAGSLPHELRATQGGKLAACPTPSTRAGWRAGLRLSHYQLFGKSQGGVAAAGIFLWWFPFFCAAEKTEKSGICAKIVQKF